VDNACILCAHEIVDKIPCFSNQELNRISRGLVRKIVGYPRLKFKIIAITAVMKYLTSLPLHCQARYSKKTTTTTQTDVIMSQPQEITIYDSLSGGLICWKVEMPGFVKETTHTASRLNILDTRNATDY
jgi:hypothetical protein